MRDSDRWITPRVVVCLILCGTLCVLATIGAVAYLTERGLDPDPMLRLAAQVAAAVGGLGSFVVTLATRRTSAKIERNTGRLEQVVWDVHDAIPRPARHAYPETQGLDMNAAPGPQGR